MRTISATFPLPPFLLLHCHALEMHPVLGVLAVGKGYASPVTTNGAVLLSLYLTLEFLRPMPFSPVSPLPPNWNNPQHIFLHRNIPNSWTNLYFPRILIGYGWQVSIVGVNLLCYLREDINEVLLVGILN